MIGLSLVVPPLEGGASLTCGIDWLVSVVTARGAASSVHQHTTIKTRMIIYVFDVVVCSLGATRQSVIKPLR